MTFYCIDRDEKYKDVQYAEGTDWEGIVCPRYDGHQRAGKRIGHMRVNIKSKKVADFLWTFLSEGIINEKVARKLAQNNVTGYSLQEVEVLNMDLIDTSLWQFIVTGQGGDAHKDSGIYLKESCPYCNHKKYSAFENGIIVDENNWDGSDIFTVNGYSRHILVTKRVKTLLEENRFTGIKLIPSEELKWPAIPKP